ncbi:5011_t:CDS:2 [Cetraspora pellucida]|uniref:5011_t:CDS:1 n=1 Tax=Cetraspora pellucida TaxID=1433469 RepID=A0ACA9NKJ2_9GLOM|nr:5011_t:CDS:2 [Cetraspora pellucida]
MYLFQKNNEPEPIHDEEECSKVRSKCSKCQTVFNKDSKATLCGEGVGYVCQSCYIPPYDGVDSGARSNAPSSNSYTDQAELTRLEQKLGVSGTPNYSPASEENKRELEDQINTFLKSQKEYSYKYGELPASLRDDNDIERERDKSSNYRAELLTRKLLKNKMTRNELPNSRILTQLLQRFTQQELADIYGVNKKTIYRKLKPSNKPKQKRGRKSKIVGRVRDLLLYLTAYRSKDNTLIQQEMADRVKKEEKVIISQQTVSRFLIKNKQNYAR